MPVPTVFARPDRLRQFRTTTAGMADGLAWRCSALDDAADPYRARTERAYEADCAQAADAVRAFGSMVRSLGDWVGTVGDTFAALPMLGPVAIVELPVLLAALPPHVPLPTVEAGDGGDGGPGTDQTAGGAGSWIDGLGAAAAGVATLTAAGAHPDDLRALAVLTGSSRFGAGVQRAATATEGTPAGRILDIGSAVTAGINETRRRWEAEADRPAFERGARAAVDGTLQAAGRYGGGTAGSALGAWACGPSVAAAPVCASAGARVGEWLGGEAAEGVSDLLLGDEPEPWERDRDELAVEIAGDEPTLDAQVAPQLDAVRTRSSLGAARHGEFVTDHPWVWDELYADAPDVPSPHPVPAVPVDGPR